MRASNPQDDNWIRKHFEDLVAKHPGEYVAVANGKVSFGKTRSEAEGKIAQKVKNILPSVTQIPQPESLTCALSASHTQCTRE